MLIFFLTLPLLISDQNKTSMMHFEDYSCCCQTRSFIVAKIISERTTAEMTSLPSEDWKIRRLL